MTVVLPLLLVVALASVLISMGFGAAELGFGAVWQCVTDQCAKPIYESILIDVRLPRVLMALVVGFALAATGALMQNVTRNPLADPYLFGIVAGAGLGATISTLLPVSMPIPFAAFLGALLSVVLVMAAVANRSWQRVEHLLLAGVAVSFLLSAVTSFLLYFGEPFAANRVIFWMMGSLARADYEALSWVIPVVITGSAITLSLSRWLDTLLVSDESARTLGVPVAKLRILVLIVCAAMTALVVAYCGGIGFVGLMIPHMVRPFVGLTTKRLLITSGLVGGCFLLWVDVLARTLIDGQEIPIGVITSVIGGFFFLHLLRRV